MSYMHVLKTLVMNAGWGIFEYRVRLELNMEEEIALAWGEEKNQNFLGRELRWSKGSGFWSESMTFHQHKYSSNTAPSSRDAEINK